jgi:hypothetical protein
MVEITIPIVLQFLQTVGILVGIIYYITIMRNQSRSRQIQILKGANILGDHIWNLFDAKFTDFDDFWEKYGFESNPEFRKDFFDYFNQLEELGVYVKDGLLDVRYLALIGGGSIITMWEMYEPVHLGLREKYGGRWFVEAEYLYGKVKDFFSQHPELSRF